MSRNFIDANQIRDICKQGNSDVIQLAGPGPKTSGHLLVYDANGNAIDGGAVPSGGGTVTHTGGALTADQPVFGAGGADIKVGTKSGNTDEVVSASGSATNGYPLLYDSNGNAIASQPRGNTTVVQLADSTTNPTNGHIAVFDANGNVKDGGAPGSGSALVLLEQHTASSSTELDFTTFFSSSYDDYEIRLVGLTFSSSGANMSLQMSTNGGSTYDTGNNYGWAALGVIQSGVTSSGGAVSDSGIRLFSAIGTTADWSVDGTIMLTNLANTSLFKRTISDVAGLGSDGNFYRIMNGGTYKITTAVNALRILPSAGNFSGIIRIYGRTH